MKHITRLLLVLVVLLTVVSVTAPASTQSCSAPGPDSCWSPW